MQKLPHLVGRAVRETGQAMDRLGLTIAGTEIFKDTVSRHRPVMSLYDKKPSVAADCFVAPTAAVIGSVTLAEKSSVWYGAVVRGDLGAVQIGRGSNVQDRAVIGTVASTAVSIGSNVTIGHGALLISCSIGDDCLVGQGAIVQERAVVDKQSILAAGAVVLPGTHVPSKQLWAGNPAAFVRAVTPEEVQGFAKSAASYSALGEQHRKAVPQ